MEKEVKIVYNVKWGLNNPDIENMDNGIYNLREVIKEVVYLLRDYHVDDEGWEEKLWEGGEVESVVIERIIEMKVGEKLYIPYANDLDMLPDVVCITAIEKDF